MVGVGETESLRQTSAALHAFNIPLISASPAHAQIMHQKENILTTAPDMSGQARVRKTTLNIYLPLTTLNLRGFIRFLKHFCSMQDKSYKNTVTLLSGKKLYVNLKLQKLQ